MQPGGASFPERTPILLSSSRSSREMKILRILINDSHSKARRAFGTVVLASLIAFSIGWSVALYLFVTDAILHYVELIPKRDTPRDWATFCFWLPLFATAILSVMGLVSMFEAKRRINASKGPNKEDGNLSGHNSGRCEKE